METEKRRASTIKQSGFQKYLFPITIISSIIVSGLVGYIASTKALTNNTSDTTELYTMKKQINIARENSTKIIEAELPKIVSDLEQYNQDLELLVNNVALLNDNLAPIRTTIDNFDKSLIVIKGINSIIELPVIGNINTTVTFARNQLKEIDRTLFNLENLTVIHQDMNNSYQTINDLAQRYDEENNSEYLFQIEKALNYNLIYQIEDLRNITIEAHKVFELSSSILVTIDKTKSLFNSVQEMGKNTLNTIQFWKDNEELPKLETDINENLENDLMASKEKIQKLPTELAERSKNSIELINNVQKEIQTLKIVQIIDNE